MAKDDARVLTPAEFERHKLVRLYVFMQDGAPLFAFESDKPPDEALADVNAGFDLPKGPTFTIAEAVTMPTADLERLRLMLDLKTQVFNIAQIAEAVRAARSGIAIARPGVGRPQ